MALICTWSRFCGGERLGGRRLGGIVSVTAPPLASRQDQHFQYPLPPQPTRVRDAIQDASLGLGRGPDRISWENYSRTAKSKLRDASLPELACRGVPIFFPIIRGTPVLHDQRPVSQLCVLSARSQVRRSLRFIRDGWLESLDPPGSCTRLAFTFNSSEPYSYWRCNIHRWSLCGRHITSASDG